LGNFCAPKRPDQKDCFWRYITPKTPKKRKKDTNIIGIDSYIFTRYIGFSWRIFNQIAQGVDYQWSPEVWKMITMSLIYCFITFVAGLTIFAKRDLNG